MNEIEKLILMEMKPYLEQNDVINALKQIPQELKVRWYDTDCYDAVRNIGKLFQSVGILPKDITKVDNLSYYWGVTMDEIYIDCSGLEEGEVISSDWLEPLSFNKLIVSNCTPRDDVTLQGLDMPNTSIIFDSSCTLDAIGGGDIQEDILKSLVIPDTVDYISSNAFWDCAIDDLYLPRNPLLDLQSDFDNFEGTVHISSDQSRIADYLKQIGVNFKEDYN